MNPPEEESQVPRAELAKMSGSRLSPQPARSISLTLSSSKGAGRALRFRSDEPARGAKPGAPSGACQKERVALVSPAGPIDLPHALKLQRGGPGTEIQIG